MKKIILTALLMMSINNAFASTSLGEDLGYQECVENVQDNRNQEKISDAKTQILESQESGTTHTSR